MSWQPTTALVVVDVQNDFADPAGGLAVDGGLEAVPVVNAAVAEAHSVGAPVVYTQDWHPAGTPHFAVNAAADASGTWPVHCVQDSWGAALHPDLDVRGQIVRKGVGGEDGYSGFSLRDPVTGAVGPTPLEALLRLAGVRELVVVGLATDYCVRATALDGRALGWPVTVLTNAVRAVELQPGDGGRALAELEAAGVVLR